MGDIADMMLDGTLCEGCGEYLGTDAGYPQYCAGCEPDQIDDQRVDCWPKASKVNCPECGKRVKAAGVEDHRRDVHGVKP
ncbi:hypothetical protein LCGC14_0354950 [marine sediment metagenome]|uniref:C2H2-type domain-containing protein n=1 Tax=marine sediment metagenome TaxID=412755 RepID=A0A0F9T9N6_9ZZZZ